jgi:hypothetical protein
VAAVAWEREGYMLLAAVVRKESGVGVVRRRVQMLIWS